LWREAGFNEMDRGLASVGKISGALCLCVTECVLGRSSLSGQDIITLAFASSCGRLEGQEPFSEWPPVAKILRVGVTALRSGVPRAPL
jgi:hypothetical protein